jgi:uncharacterized membrane protein YeaQ/YmgE (transglycosylase-associated protein family)
MGNTFPKERLFLTTFLLSYSVSTQLYAYSLSILNKPKGGHMSFLLWIILGLIAGWLASVIMKTDSSQGPLLDIILGVVGASIGGFVFNMFGMSGVTGFDFYSLIVATIGAVILIWIGRMLSPRL